MFTLILSFIIMVLTLKSTYLQPKTYVVQYLDKISIFKLTFLNVTLNAVFFNIFASNKFSCFTRIFTKCLSKQNVDPGFLETYKRFCRKSYLMVKSRYFNPIYPCSSCTMLKLKTCSTFARSFIRLFRWATFFC